MKKHSLQGGVGHLFVDDKTQKCIRFHGSLTPTTAHYTSTLCFKRNRRLSYAWPAKPLNCWSGVSPWIKSSVPWIKGRNALNTQILSLATGTQALWLLKCTALKWKGLFLASALFPSASAHLGVSVIAVVILETNITFLCLYLSQLSSPPATTTTCLNHELSKKRWSDIWRLELFFFFSKAP